MRELIKRILQARRRPPAAPAGEAGSVHLSGAELVRGGRAVLREVRLFLPPGRLYGVVGSAGSGKTLLLEVLAGLRLAAAGLVQVGGIDGSRPAAALRRHSAYVPPALPRRPGATLRRTLLRQAALCGLPPGEAGGRVEAVAARLGLTSRLPEPLSGLEPLEAALAGLAWGLLRRPRLLAVDEPAAPLDRPGRRAFWEELARLRQEGYTVVGAARGLAEPWRLADEVILLREGRATFPTAEELARLEGALGFLEIRLAVPPRILPPELAAFRPEVAGRVLRFRLADPAGQLSEVVEAVLNANLRIEDLNLDDGGLLAEAIAGGGPGGAP